MAQLQRRDIVDYINTTPSEETALYSLMGTGFTSLDESPNAQTEKKTYITDKSGTTRVNSYEGKFKFESDRIEDDAAIDYLVKIGEEQLTGSDAETTYIRVNKDEKVGETEGVYYARKFNVSVEVTDLAGKPGEGATISGNLNQIGDVVIGTFTLATKTFTANV